MRAEDGPGPEIGYTGARFGGPSRRKARKREIAAEAPDPAVPDAVVAAQEEEARRAAHAESVTEVFPAVGSAPAARAADAAPGDGPDGDRDDDTGRPAVGYTGARFGGPPRRRRKPAPEPEPAPQAVVPAPPPLPPLPGVEPEETYIDPASSSSVRPYVYTRGRTRSQFELSIEALVSVVPTAPTAHMSGEHQAVVGLCREIRSVAEIGALLGVPLGVARVLVGDLAAAGVVSLHRTAGAAGPDLALMERVLSGLRRL